jgi:hypothetical protein
VKWFFEATTRVGTCRIEDKCDKINLEFTTKDAGHDSNNTRLPKNRFLSIWSAIFYKKPWLPFY